MTAAPFANNIRTSRYAIPIFIVLIAAGLAGNYFPFSILNAHFIFGSIFAMLALQLFGWGRGVIAAAIIAGYTYLAWNHPWAIVTMTAEAVVVGWLINRRKINLVMADALYWLFIGIPLGYLCFHVISDFPVSNTMFLMTKQGINGIANALIARLIYSGYTIHAKTSLVSFREAVSNLLMFFVLCSSMITLTLDGRADLAETDRRIRTALIRDSRNVTDNLENWVEDRKRPVVNLAAMAATLSPAQMQPRMEQARRSDDNFLRIALLDKNALAVAYAPRTDELGRSAMGMSYADRPHIQILKQTLKPMLSETVVSKIGRHDPIVLMKAPVLIRGEYGGYVSGVLNFDRIRTILKIHSTGGDVMYTLLDKNGSIILTNRSDQQTLQSFIRPRGSINRLGEGISHWVPMLPANTPTIELWGKSIYVAESAIGRTAEWKLILEQPVAPFQKNLYDRYINKFFILFAILLASLALAEFLSRRIVATIEELRLLTRNLPARLASDSQIAWPESAILETDHLIANVREMADSLQARFAEIRQINELLEHRIEERTEELRKSETFLHDIVENIPAMIFMKDAADLRFVKFNRAGEELIGYSRSELLGKSDYDFFPKEEADFFTEKDREVIARGQLVEIQEESIQTRNRGVRTLHTKKIPICNTQGTPQYLLGISEDITERKQSEDTLHKVYKELQASQIATLKVLEDLKVENEARKKNEAALQLIEAEIRTLNAELEQRVTERTARLESAYNDIEAFSYSVSHDLKAPLRAISGFASIIARRHREGLNEEACHYFDNIVTASERMSALITDLLEYSRIGRKTIDLRPAPLAPILTQVVDVLSGKIEETGAKISLPDSLPVVLGDSGLIRQAFTNLIENALIFRKRDIPLIIEIGYTLDKGRTTIRVADNGIGIPEEFHEKIFNMFQRLHSEDQYPGTGIGLAIVRKALKLMDGQIRVESETGKGSTFFVTFRKE